MATLLTEHGRAIADVAWAVGTFWISSGDRDGVHVVEAQAYVASLNLHAEVTNQPDEDEAMVKITGSLLRRPLEIAFVRVQGRWIPKYLAENWEAGIGRAQETVAATLSTLSGRREEVLHQLDECEKLLNDGVPFRKALRVFDMSEEERPLEKLQQQRGALDASERDFDEAHVRLIMLDIALGDTYAYFNAHSASPDPKEAIRRWDAGVRVRYANKFERKIVRGSWHQTGRGTDIQVDGLKVQLTTDSVHEIDPAADEGTWTDPKVGLTWQVRPTGGRMNLENAKALCASLSLGGGGWRLPSIGELRTLFRGCSKAALGGSCNVQEGRCMNRSCRDVSCMSSGCDYGSGPGQNGMYWPDEIKGPCCRYWSSSPVGDINSNAWHGNPGVGGVDTDHSGNKLRVRCVRQQSPATERKKGRKSEAKIEIKEKKPATKKAAKVVKKKAAKAKAKAAKAAKAKAKAAKAKAAKAKAAKAAKKRAAIAVTELESQTRPPKVFINGSQSFTKAKSELFSKGIMLRSDKPFGDSSYSGAIATPSNGLVEGLSFVQNGGRLMLVLSHQNSSRNDNLQDVLGISIAEEGILRYGKHSIDASRILPMWWGQTLGLPQGWNGIQMQAYLVLANEDQWQTQSLVSSDTGKSRMIAAYKKLGRGELLLVTGHNLNGDYIRDQTLELLDNRAAFIDRLLPWLAGITEFEGLESHIDDDKVPDGYN